MKGLGNRIGIVVLGDEHFVRTCKMMVGVQDVVYIVEAYVGSRQTKRRCVGRDSLWRLPGVYIVLLSEMRFEKYQFHRQYVQLSARASDSKWLLA